MQGLEIFDLVSRVYSIIAFAFYSSFGFKFGKEIIIYLVLKSFRHNILLLNSRILSGTAPNLMSGKISGCTEEKANVVHELLVFYLPIPEEGFLHVSLSL